MQSITKVVCMDPVATRLKDFVLSEMDRRFKSVEHVLPFGLATVLDPRYKDIHFENLSALAKVKNFISSELRKEKRTEDEPEPTAEVQEKTSSNSIWDVHDDLVKSENKKRAEVHLFEVGLDQELKDYLNDNLGDRNENPFELWEKMKFKYPHLYLMAKTYLASIATSVPSERLFSRAKLVADDL